MTSLATWRGINVLVEITKRFHACLRPYDSIGRYGGEEFLFVLPGSDSLTATKQAERIQASLADEPIVVPGSIIPVTVSQGVTTWTSLHADNVRALIQTADSALYLVKSSGRDGVEFMAYEEESQSRSLMVPRQEF